MPRHLPVAAIVAVVLALGALGPGSAHAQPADDPRAVGPYRGLFGANNGAGDHAHLVDVTFGVFGGYDDDVSRRQGSRPSDPDTQAASTYTGGAASLRYVTKSFERVSFETRANAATSYYPDLDDLVATSYGATASLGWQPTPRTSLSARYRFRYSPFFGYSVYQANDLPELDLPDGTWSDTRVVRRENFTNAGGLSIRRELSLRSSVYASASYRVTNFVHEDSGFADTERWGAGAGWNYRMTEHATARLGYGYSSGSSSDTGTATGAHLIDAGVDYGRALSFSRRTRFSFGMGSAGYARNDLATEGTSFENFRYTIVGDAQLTHELGESWVAGLFVSRRVRFYDGFSDPFLGSVAGGTIAGFLGPRVRLAVTAGLQWGEYGNTASTRFTRSTYVTPTAQYALTSNLALSATYYFYRYYFEDGAAPLPDDLPQRASRQGFRVALSVWLPLVRAGVAR